MSGEFWNVLQRLANKSEDDFILVGVIDPHPVNYFYKEFRCFNWIKVSTALTNDEYWSRLESGPEDSEADAILYNSFTVVWIPLSGKWARGDRDGTVFAC